MRDPAFSLTHAGPRRAALPATLAAFVLLATTAFGQPTPTPKPPVGVLENPPPGSSVSGIGLVSGWVCEAGVVDVTINGFFTLGTAYGTKRGDTASVCGDTDNGFGLLFNWNLLGDGEHLIVAYADGVEVGRSTFRVTTLGVPFLRDKSAVYPIVDFPTEGRSFALQWVESVQNFLIVPPLAQDAASAEAAPTTAIEYPQATLLGVLENPTDGGRASGIGLASGWVCGADQVEVVIDDAIRLEAAYPTVRGDTAAQCGGNPLTGFGVLFNWNLLSNGKHTAVALADGMEFARATFRVRKIGDTFLRDVSGTYLLEDFPNPGADIEVQWVQAAQNFMISARAGTLATPIPTPTKTPGPTPPKTPTPTPTPPPGVTPPMPSGCPNGFLSDGGNGKPGFPPGDPFIGTDIRLQEGERRVYCANLPLAARRVQFAFSKQCQGANVLMTVTPPPLNFGDGTAMQVQETTRSANYGSLPKPPGYVPAGTFLVDVLGLAVGGDCQNNGSRINLSWQYDL